MSLIICPVCGREVETQAQPCPHCGYRFAKEQATALSAVETNYQAKQAEPQEPVQEPVKEVIVLKENKTVTLHLGTMGTSALATIFKVMAVLIWVGGLFASIALANASKTRSYADFPFGTFLLYLLAFGFAGFMEWLFGGAIQAIIDTRDMVAGASVEVKDQPDKKPVPITEKTTYRLFVGGPTGSTLASILRIAAVLTWIGGFITAICLARVTTYSTYRYSVIPETTFSFWAFVGYLLGFGFSGFMQWLFAGVVDAIMETRDMVAGIELSSTVEKVKPESTKKTISSHPIAKKVARTWQCEKCGTPNDSNAIFCKNCGAYK